MTALIDIVWILFGSIMLIVASIYAYYLFRVQDLFDKYKQRDMRYDG